MKFTEIALQIAKSLSSWNSFHEEYRGFYQIRKKI